MRINTNIGALTAAGNLSRVNDAVKSSTEKLSSGFRINKAADDAAGLGVANMFRADIRALTQAQRNAEQATSVFQIAEGGATGIQKILERMKELAAQAASDSVDSGGRARIDAEYQALSSEIDRIGMTTEFQGSKLLDGSYGSSVSTDAATAKVSITTSLAGSVTLSGAGALVTATNGAITQTLAYTSVAGATMDFSALGLKITNKVGAVNGIADIATAEVTTTASSGTFLIGAAHNVNASYSNPASNVLQIAGSDLNLTASTLKVSGTATSTLAASQAALSAVDSALSLVNTALGAIGAGQNRLTSAIDNIKSTVLNYQAAESAIRDLDMASEMVTFSKNQIIAQAGMAMLAQANQAGQNVLKLLQ